MDDGYTTRPVLIYDGACGFCVASVRLLERLDRHNRLATLDAQDWATVEGNWPTLTPSAVMGQLHVITPDGRSYAGFDGVRVVLRDLPLVAWLYPALHLPGMTWVGRKGYDWVARHRYAISRLMGMADGCDGGACQVRPPSRR